MPQLRFLVSVLASTLSGVCFSGYAAEHSSLISDFVEAHCIECHDRASATGGLSLENVDSDDLGQDVAIWEKTLRRIQRREMPPLDMPRPDEEEYDAVIAQLTTRLDAVASKHPNPGRTDTFRRLTRTEYGNAIRDLLSVQVDVNQLLPADESSHGFDNVTVGNLSPTLLNRYISAAEKISLLAVGGKPRAPLGYTVRLRPDMTQEEHVEGLPLGTRGGTKFDFTFPRDGVYEIQVRLMRDRNEHVEGLTREHELEVLLDRGRIEVFKLQRPNSNGEHATADAHLHVSVPIKAGTHEVAVTFLKQSASLIESKRQPYDAHFNFYRHPRLTPAIYEVSITGPHSTSGTGNTPSRQLIFGDQVRTGDPEQQAEQLLRPLMRRAYRRPINKEDLQQPMQFFQGGYESGDFESGIQAALVSILVNPNFLFRIESDPPRANAQTAYLLNQFELASRLSFFLWSSLPDDQLLDLAEQGRLRDPETLEQQVHRMLNDHRASSLVDNFASQWLYLRNLDSLAPDLRSFPDFDDNLRQAFRQETELFFESIVREDRSVLDLVSADYTFLNERLAKHYEIPHIYGSRFRRVAIDEDQHRGGLLRQGSILMATSYPTRTSPVIRGKWILENLLGSPPPPPPENVPPLEDNTVAANLPVRERLAIHRENEACSSCHNLIDPIGLALENFDAVGRWRNMENGTIVDASGGMPDGSKFAGPDGLEAGLLARPEMFVGTMSEKLLTYALGRGIEPHDAPAIRTIVQNAEGQDYRFSSLILGIVNSTPFQMRMTE